MHLICDTVRSIVISTCGDIVLFGTVEQHSNAGNTRRRMQSKDMGQRECSVWLARVYLFPDFQIFLGVSHSTKLSATCQGVW